VAVVSPRRFVDGYEARIARTELAALKLDHAEQAHVLVIVSSGDRGITLNLKAPVVLNFERGLGRQVIALGDQPLQFVLESETPPSRKAA
jgi:flagellar assembly factor FliW